MSKELKKRKVRKEEAIKEEVRKDVIGAFNVSKEHCDIRGHPQPMGRAVDLKVLFS